MSNSPDISASWRPPTPQDLGGGSVSTGACATAGAARWRRFALVLCAVLLTRLVAETVNTFLWDRANYVWSCGALAVFALLLWPWLLMLARGEGNIFAGYFPVFAYLALLLARLQFADVYALKCFLSEIVLWSCFLFTVEVCSRSAQAAALMQTWLIRVVKGIVHIGIAQLVFALANQGSVSPRAILESRPVRGVFYHPNIFLVVILPFLFYFLKRRDWLWLLLTALACLGTGCRSPWFAALCLSPLIFRSAFHRPITWRYLALTLVIVAAAYGLLIRWNRAAWDYREDSRTNLSTLQWRIAFWRQFLEDDRRPAFWLGHGVGSADRAAGKLWGEDMLPHNDYLRTYYDLGIAGLLVTGLLIAFMIRLLMRSSAAAEVDFILLAYLVITCFRFTDNFMYVTIPVWIYMFMGSFALRPAACGGDGGSDGDGGEPGTEEA